MADEHQGRHQRSATNRTRDLRASIIDLELTTVVDGDLVKVMSWYDNEWGYANQMLREAASATRGVSSPST